MFTPSIQQVGFPEKRSCLQRLFGARNPDFNPDSDNLTTPEPDTYLTADLNKTRAETTRITAETNGKLLKLALPRKTPEHIKPEPCIKNCMSTGLIKGRPMNISLAATGIAAVTGGLFALGAHFYNTSTHDLPSLPLTVTGDTIFLAPNGITVKYVGATVTGGESDTPTTAWFDNSIETAGSATAIAANCTIFESNGIAHPILSANTPVKFSINSPSREESEAAANAVTSVCYNANITSSIYFSQGNQTTGLISARVINTSPSPMPSVTPSMAPTHTPTVSPSVSATPSITPSIPATPSITPSIPTTPSATPTPGQPSPAPTQSLTPSSIPTQSVSQSPSPTQSVSPSTSPSPTQSATPMPTPTPTPTNQPASSCLTFQVLSPPANIPAGREATVKVADLSTKITGTGDPDVTVFLNVALVSLGCPVEFTGTPDACQSAPIAASKAQDLLNNAYTINDKVLPGTTKPVEAWITQANCPNPLPSIVTANIQGVRGVEGSFSKAAIISLTMNENFSELAVA
ncbi:MAG: hypothetical protein Q7V63_09910 [Gammaproteobacteria bacterium]|nr:hypothetical protein [Gammaproteobacteria bacterium]